MRDYAMAGRRVAACAAMLAGIADQALAADGQWWHSPGWGGGGWGRRRTTTTQLRTTAAPPAPTTPAPAPAPAPAPPPAPVPDLPPGQCHELSAENYVLDWQAAGHSFFDTWDFLTWDANNGAAQYLNREEAAAEHVTEAHSSHAILRVGARGEYLKRKSAKIRTQRQWKYFLAAVRFTHVPFGCGIWPAFWTLASGVPWPEGGELDILEYANDIASQTSLHTGESNRCLLDGSKVTRAGCPPMPDMNGGNYECKTAYPDSLGCAPNKLPLQSPAEWNLHPVTFAIEWTEDFIKIFKIPDYELPTDLVENRPQPNSWDQWLASYYPLRQSGASCPDPANVMAPQHLVLNIGLCGDWAGKIWDQSPTCTALAGPQQGCRAVDPMFEDNFDDDCCTQFTWDGDGAYGSDGHFAANGFFNVSWVKVFQQR
mmetsp:Transcript_21188/g.63306  ORF Transcript_21188/g.63306 Transcript_21188/m.63306 type:complete len:427 (-) Transcript_21188:29-1309(-)